MNNPSADLRNEAKGKEPAVSGAAPMLRRSIVLAIILLVMGGIFFWHWQKSDAKAVAEYYWSGFPPNITLLGLQPEREDTGAMELPSRSSRRTPMSLLIERVLADAPADADIEAVAGTNWTSVARWEQSLGVCLGADAWRKCALACIARKDESPGKCAERLRNWPSALYHFSQTGALNRDFMERIVKRLERDGKILLASISGRAAAPDVQKLAWACALYEASFYMKPAGFAAKWRDRAADSIGRYLEAHQKPDGTIAGDANATLGVIETVMPAIAVAYRAGKKIEPDLAGRVQALMEFPMCYLDADGCLPFINDEAYYSSNKREWLFWAARAFNRQDFAWVAYGGLDMLDSSPPARCSRAFPDAGIYVMRNNWEIRRVIRRRPLLDSEPQLTAGAKQFAYMSNTLHFDARRGVFQIFAFGLPQIMVNLPVRDLQPVWRETDDLTICQSQDGQRQLAIIQLDQLNAWVLQIRDMNPEEEVTIQPVTTQLKRAPDGAGIVSYSEQQPHWMYDEPTRLLIKRYGSVCARADGIIREIESGGFAIKANPETRRLTIVFLAANGTGYQGPARTGVPAEEAAAARKVAFTEKGCVFEDDIWRSPLAPRIASETGNKVLLEMSADGSIHLVSRMAEGVN